MTPLRHPRVNFEMDVFTLEFERHAFTWEFERHDCQGGNFNESFDFLLAIFLEVVGQFT